MTFCVYDLWKCSLALISLANKKLVSKPKVVSMMSKIKEHKLTGTNYLDWSKTIRIYLRSIHMASHLTKDPPNDDSKE